MSQNKKDNFLDGYYIGSKQIQGKDGMFTVHTIHKVEENGTLGEKVDVIGNKVLNELMETTTMGSYVGVQYMGRQHKKGNEGKPWSQTNSYHIWKLFVDEGAVKYGSLSGSAQTSEKAPAAKQEEKAPAAQKKTEPVQESPFPEDDNDDLPF